MKKIATVVYVAVIVLALQTVPECAAQLDRTSFIPPPSDVDIMPQTNGETVSVTVTVHLRSTCYSLGGWGGGSLWGNQLHADAQFWVVTNGVCLLVSTDVSETYQFGWLAPGDYSFVFSAWRLTEEVWRVENVKTQMFSVPLRLSIVPPQTGPEVQLRWNAATSSWYRVEYSANPGTNDWAALTGWLPGNGNRLSTTDAVLVGQSPKFYRIAATNAPGVR